MDMTSGESGENAAEESGQQASPPTNIPPATAQVLPPSQTSWPVVVGTVAIVWAAISLVGSGCSLIMSPFYRMVAQMRETEGASDAELQQYQAVVDSGPWLIVVGVVGIILASLLLTGGIYLVRRMRIGAKLLIIWSIICLIWLPVQTTVSVFMMDAWLMPETEDAAPGEAEALIGGMIGGLIGGACSLLLALAVPIFLLVWFTRPRIRNEIATWPR